MQGQLIQLEKDCGIKWLEFSIGDIFDVGTGSLVDVKTAKKGNIPRISVQTTDNGILGYFDEYLENARYFENFITVNFFGIAFYHHYRASVEMKVHTLKLKEHEFTKQEGVFFSALLNKRFDSLYSYGNQLSSSKIKNDGFKIMLPAITENNETSIAFDFIEKFINMLGAERLATIQGERQSKLSAYLIATGLKDYDLTSDESAALESFETVSWSKFKIEDVLDWQKNISELNPLHLKSLSVSDEKKYPFYGQSTTNNGVIEYRHLVDDVLNNDLGKPTILIHSNNQNTVYLETPFYLKDGHGATSVLQSEHLNKITAKFLIGSIKKVILQKYTYNAKATKIELKGTYIALPINQDGSPNYDYMSLYIAAMQKVVIKNVMDSLDIRIDKTAEILTNDVQ